MKVTIESADSDPVDDLIVNNSSGPITGEPQVSAKDESVAGKLTITLTWPNNVPDNITLNVLWSKNSNPGNWMLSEQDITIPFNSSCGDSDDSDDINQDDNTSSDPLFNDAFDGTSIDGDIYEFPSSAQSWAGFANKNESLYPLSFPYGGKITLNAATQGSDVSMNFKFERKPYNADGNAAADTEPYFSTDNVTISGTSVTQYTFEIPVRPQTQTYSSWLMYLVTRDAGVSITDIAINSYTELPASEDGSCSVNTSLSSGSDNQSMNLGSAITDIVYDINTDCTQIIHLIESTGLPTGVTASIAGTTLTISGTPAGGSSGTYNYSLKIDNHLEQTSSEPFVAATASSVITGSITVVDLSTKLTLPFNFEDESLVYDFADFDGGNLTRVANPDASGINTSSYVGKMVKDAGETWAGSSYILENAIDFSEKKFFTMKVRVPKASVQVLLKLESTSSNGNPIEVNATSTQVDTWETLTFDFSNVDTNGSYDKLVWIFENGTAGDGSDQFTYYVDNLFQKESASACSIEVSLETQGTDDQTVDYSSSIEDINYNIITDCIELIHLVDSYGLPSGVSATITGDILTISGTPASVSSGTYDYSVVIDNHLEETSTDPFRAATVSKVIEGSITVNNEVTYTVEVPNGTQTVNFLSDLYGWDANVTATDNGDGTWSHTVTPAPTSDVNYVWIVDGVQENLLAANAAGCDAFVQGTTFNTDGSSFANRLWKVGSGDQSGYYNGCDTANLTSVTFTVTVPGTHTSVHFNSSIWGWDPGQKVTATPSDTAGVYTHTISPAPSANIEYLWIVDDTQESLVSVAQAGCDALVQDVNFNTDSSSYANRLWKVGSADQSGIYNACSDPVTYTVEVPNGTQTVNFLS
ncbi:MAG: putative Ig domain-containing protein, partial [Flavobacteriaceae bacterium]